MIRSLIAGAMILGCGAAAAQVPPDVEARLPAPAFRVYVIAVCAASEEITDDCVSQGMRLAAYSLSEMYLRTYQGRFVWNSLRLRFPYGWVEASQIRFLRDVEQAAILLTRAQLERDGGGIEAIEAWQMHALAESVSGENWAHDWTQNRHDFAPANVTRQLRQANLMR